MDYLVEVGMDVHAQNKYGQTPLHFAGLMGSQGGE